MERSLHQLLGDGTGSHSGASWAPDASVGVGANMGFCGSGKGIRPTLDGKTDPIVSTPQQR